MKHHVMIALGILLGIIFALRTAVALLEPGLGMKEVYLVGGLVLSGWLLVGGLSEWRHAKAGKSGETGPDRG